MPLDEDIKIIPKSFLVEETFKRSIVRNTFKICIYCKDLQRGSMEKNVKWSSVKRLSVGGPLKDFFYFFYFREDFEKVSGGETF